MANFWRNVDLDNDGDANNEVRVAQGNAGVHIYWIEVYNPNATAIFLNLYNATHANVDPAATTPTITIGVPAASSKTIPLDIHFSTALNLCASTTAAPGGSTPTSDVVVTVFFE